MSDRTHIINLVSPPEVFEGTWIIERCNPVTLAWEKFETLYIEMDEDDDPDIDHLVEERIEEITSDHDRRTGAYYRATNPDTKQVIIP